MRAIILEGHGEADVLKLGERPTPEPGKDEVRVRVRATAVNRADVVQRRGHYPAPPDSPQDILGLEYAGEVDALGAGAHEWNIGDRVYGLAGGGTYAEYIVVPSRTLARIPQHLSFVEAASVPEAFLTAYDAVVSQCGLSAGEKLLISAVGSGVGTAAVQIARAIGALSVGTARTPEKLEAARELGMDHGVVARDGKFAEEVLKWAGAGVDVVLELVGGNYLAEDLRAATTTGRIILVGLMAGAKTEADLGTILRKRLMIRGTTMRMRPLEEKILAGQVLAKHLSPMFEKGLLKPVVAKLFPLDAAAQAHRYMESNENFGKIVLEVS